MDRKRLIELAIEGLHAKKQAIELEIEALSKGVKAAVSTLRGSPAAAALTGIAPAPKRKKRSAASRKAQAAKMRAYWAKRKAQGGKSRPPKRGRKASATARVGV